jgi:RNA polymerase sigma-70 factor (ECF subfamily)
MNSAPRFTAIIDSALLMARAREEEAPAELAETAALVRRTLAGDAAAFEQIMIRHERRVFTLAMKLLGSSDDAKDAVQEVFLRAFKYIHRFNVQKRIEPWLMQMTVNVCRNIGRNRQRRWNMFPDTVQTAAAAADDRRDPYSGLAEEQDRRLLWKALDALPQKERMALILRDIDGLSTSEVAQILASSETTVRSQISRARVRMKETIARMMGGRL